jgi:predicted porin
MNKTAIAVAVAGARAAPVAMAQGSTVQIGGSLHLIYGIHNPNNDSISSKHDNLHMSEPEMFVRGEEKLGGGLSAWFQCTTTADPRGQSQNGWCSRNSALGMKGGFGNVFIGNWDTPFKRTISPTNVGGNDTGIWGTAFLLTGDSTTDQVGVNRANFKKRQANSINYDSPNFAGFQVLAAFTTSQPSTGTLSAATNNKPRVYSLGVQYSAGPLYVSGGYEQHREYAGGTINNSKDNGWHLGAAYTWGPVRFGGQYTQQTFDAPGGDVKAKAWHVGVDWNIVGPHGLRAAYTQARDMSGPVGVLVGTASGSGYRPAPAAGGRAPVRT